MSKGDSVARILAALAAVLIAGWLAVGLRSSALEERGKKAVVAATRFSEVGESQTRSDRKPRIGVLVLNDPTPAQALTLRRAARDLDRATWLIPDGALRIHYAQALLILGEKRRARQLARAVSLDYPDDLAVWRTAEAIALVLPDRALVTQARRRIRELNPR